MAGATFIALAFMRSSGLKYNGLHHYLRRKEQLIMRGLTRSEGVYLKGFPPPRNQGKFILLTCHLLYQHTLPESLQGTAINHCAHKQGKAPAGQHAPILDHHGLSPTIWYCHLS
jgi:hypothetical protein